MHRLGAWIPQLLVGCVVYISGSPCAPHYGFCFHFCTVESKWLLYSYTQQQPGERGADQRLQGVEKVWASTSVLQGEGRWVEPGSVNCTDSLIVTLLPVRKCCYGEVKVKAIC